MKFPYTAILLLFLLVQSGFSSDSENQEIVRQFIKATKSFDVLSKDVNADAFAKESIASYGNSSPFADSRFDVYMLKKAGEKARILYAIKLITSDVSVSSSGVAEAYRGYAIILLERRLSNLNKAEQGGADQPVTAPESKSEGKEKAKPESEGRSQ
jgi:hypothetical protein